MNSGMPSRTAAIAIAGADVAADAELRAEPRQANVLSGGRKPIAASNAGRPPASR